MNGQTSENSKVMDAVHKIMDAVRAAYPTPNITLAMLGNDARPSLYQIRFNTPGRGECLALFTVEQREEFDPQAWIERNDKTPVTRYRLNNATIYGGDGADGFGTSTPMNSFRAASLDEAVWDLIARYW